jgi:hypothetical protein
MQNSRLLVASSAVLKPPQKIMPVTKDMDEMAKIEYLALGFLKKFQIRFKKPGWSLDMGLLLNA